MAIIDSTSYITGIHGKVCRHSQDEFRTNSCSGVIVLSKKCNPYTGEATDAQKAVRSTFKERSIAIHEWLDDNRAKYYSATDTEVTSGSKTTKDIKTPATALYKEALKIKKNEHLSTITQALALYQSNKTPYAILLPSEGGTRNGSSSSSSSSDGDEL